MHKPQYVPKVSQRSKRLRAAARGSEFLMAKRRFETTMVTVFNREPGRLILECALTVPVEEWSKADTPEQRFKEDARRTLRAIRGARSAKMPKQVSAFLNHLEAYLRSALRKNDHIQATYNSGDPMSPYPSAAKMLREKTRAA
jgi:hypothetical protein